MIFVWFVVEVALPPHEVIKGEGVIVIFIHVEHFLPLTSEGIPPGLIELDQVVEFLVGKNFGQGGFRFLFLFHL